MWYAALLGAFLTLLSSVVGRVLIALSIGYVTYTGFSVLSDFIIAQVWANLDSLPSNFKCALGILNVDKAINVLFSAYSVRFLFTFLPNGNMAKLKFKSL